MLTVLAVIILVGLSGIFSGLTLGLLSLSTYELKRKAELGDKKAKAVYPIRATGNELLVSLIIVNTLVNAALTVMLNSILAGFLAVVLATVLITLFGEIIPQSVLKKHGLEIGAKLAPFITIVMKALHPVSAPLGRVLDRAFGGDSPTIYSKEELYKILDEHQESESSDIEADELQIVKHVLSYGDKPIKDVMTPRSAITAADVHDLLSARFMKDLHDSGHSRFPVFKGDIDHIVGTLYLRDLANMKTAKTVNQAMEPEVYYVNENEKLDHALNAILTTKHQLFVVVNEFEETVGLITITDIVEEIIGRKIHDQFDKYDDLRLVAKLKAKAKSKEGHHIVEEDAK